MTGSTTTTLFLSAIFLLLLYSIILGIKVPTLSEIFSPLQRVLIALILYTMYNNHFFFLLIIVFTIEAGFRGWKYLKTRIR